MKGLGAYGFGGAKSHSVAIEPTRKPGSPRKDMAIRPNEAIGPSSNASNEPDIQQNQAMQSNQADVEEGAEDEVMEGMQDCFAHASGVGRGGEALLNRDFIKTLLRNRLENPHLTDCIRLYTLDHYDLSTFPYERAMKLWLEEVKRRGVELAM